MIRDMEKVFVLFFALPVLLMATPIELANGHISIRIDPQLGGKIVCLRRDDIEFSAPPSNEFGRHFLGLAKERIYGDASEYLSRPWQVVERGENRLVLKISGQKPPQQFLGITKIYTLPPQAAYIQVELIFENTAPLAGQFKIVPWVHNGFSVAAPEKGKNNMFMLSHDLGVSHCAYNKMVSTVHCLQRPGNWTAYLNSSEEHGLLMVSETKPAVGYNYISKTTSTLEFLYPSVDPVPEYKVKYFLAPIKSLEPEEISGLHLPLPLLPPPSEKHTSGTRVSLKEYFGTATEKDIPITFRFWKAQAWVAPELPLPLVFGLLKRVADGEMILEIDLPEFVSLDGHTSNYWRMDEKMDLLSSEPITLENQQYVRHRFAVTARPSARWHTSHCVLFAQAKRSEGTGKVYYRGYLDGDLIMSDEVPCDVLSIPAAKAPQRFKFWMSSSYSIYKSFPNFIASMRHLGVNGVCIGYNVPNKFVSVDEIKDWNVLMKKAGFSTAVMGAQFFALPRDKRYQAYQAIDIDGKVANVFDFTIREGDWVQQRIDHAVKFGTSLGYDLVISDYEAYFGGHRYSFTPRTLAAFEKHCRDSFPEMPLVDALTVAKNPELYPQQNKVWIDFKCHNYAEAVKILIDSTRRLHPGGSAIGWCTITGASDAAIKMDNLLDNAQFCEFLDYTMPMTYNNIYRGMSSYRSEIEMFLGFAEGRRAKVAPTLCAGFWGSASNFPAEHSGFMLLETALTGCEGAYLFSGFTGTDNLGIQHLSRSLDLIARTEDIVHGGKRADHLVKILNSQNSTMQMPAKIEPLVIVNGRQLLLYLAEYSEYPITAEVQFDLQGRCRVKSLTGNTIPDFIAPWQKLRIEMQPGLGKAWLLLLETEDGKDFPPEFIKAQVETKSSFGADTEGLLFADSFETTTQGKNGNSFTFSFADEGYQGCCLAFPEYRAFWLLQKEFDITEGEVTFEFFYQCPRIFYPKAGSKSIDLLHGQIDEERYFTLFFDGASGKMVFAINQKGVGWSPRLLSTTERWPANIWQKISLSFGKNGVLLKVDGKTEIEAKEPIALQSLADLQIGRKWCSFGRFDELRVFSRRK